METFEHIMSALERAFEEKNVQREHDLIRLCQTDKLSPLCDLKLSYSLDLFKAHFIVRHCLYQLQEHWRSKELYELEIDLVEIKRKEYAPGVSGIESFNYLRDYYLDLDNLLETSEAEVNLLLSGFWNHFNNIDQRARALDLLGLSSDADYSQIKRKFRTLAQQMHPDKGGSAEAFQELVAAKNTLEALRNV